MPAPASICLLRTSAIGDVTHVVPLVHTLQQAWPQTRLSWIIGRREYTLLGDLPGVTFVTLDKHAGLAGMRHVWQILQAQRFDVLLHIQVALRSNLLSLGIKAGRRIGYDHARSKNLHEWFINEHIATRSGEHVLDTLGSFVEPLGLVPGPVRWDIPIPEEAREWAARQLPGDDTPTLLVSPCSSHVRRSWLTQRYAAVMNHASARGWRVALIGGASPVERAVADAIMSCCVSSVLDFTGKDTLKKLLALLKRARLLLTPDSGPMHMANAVGTKVLGLHAASNPRRSGPYSDRRWCVDKYDEAARNYLHKPADELAWGRKIEFPGVMALIPVNDVIERFEAFAVHAGLA